MRSGARLCLVVLAIGAVLDAGSSRGIAADLRIGIAAPLSGPDAVFGDQIRLGASQAVADVNRSGGFLGQQASVVVRDDKTDPKRAAEVAKSFVADRISIVIGDLSSAATVSASTIYGEAGALEITPSALAPLVTERGLTTVFRTCGRDDEAAEAAARALLSRHLTRIAIVHDRTTSGKAFADSVRKVLAADGLKDVFYGSFDPGSRDVSALVGRVKASGAQVVVFGGAGAPAGVLARQMRDANSRVTLLGSAALASDEFTAAAGAGAEGTLMVFPSDVKGRPAAADLLRRLRDAHIEPDALVFYAYAAVQVVQQSAAAAASTDPARLGAVMHSGYEFRTVIGSFAFDAKGDRTTPDYVVHIWHRGITGRMTFDEPAKS